MEALRTIVHSDQLASFLDLPVGLRNQDVEVIVLPSKQQPVNIDEPATVDLPSPFTAEQREQFRQHREKLMKQFYEKRKHSPRMSSEEFHQLLLRCPVVDEETIKMQDEVREEMRQWRMK
jgi:hypothetical protein